MIGLAALLFFAAGAGAAEPPLPVTTVVTNVIAAPPLPPPPANPVALFRDLLAAPAPARLAALSNRPVELRQRILAKVTEYERMPASERDEKLRATEVSFYLELIPQLPATNRASLVSQLPPALRSAVATRLAAWIQPPPPLPGFERMFELPAKEKTRVLAYLPDAERAQIERTLAAFDTLQPAQRIQCIVAFGKFAGLSAADREAFLKNAERWREMSPTDRESWTRLVEQAQLEPPPPPLLVAPPPPPAPQSSRATPAVATNRN